MVFKRKFRFLLILGMSLVAARLLFVPACRLAIYGIGNHYDPMGDAFWKLEFLKQSSPFQTAPRAFWQHDVHPTRGWTPRPNFVATGERTETTNNRGHRSREDYVFAPEKYTVMVLGDSFTYGAWANDDEVWPTILQEFDDRLHVINLGVGGYGTDQMYITERETIEEYRPQLVVFAPATDDPNRSLLSFREYRKPRFVLDGQGNLALTNTPIGSIPETRAALIKEYGSLMPRIGLSRENDTFEKYVLDGTRSREWTALNSKILQEALRCARDHGAEFMVVHLEVAGDVSREPGHHYQPTETETLLAEFSEKNEVPFLPTRVPFLDSGKKWVMGHYKGAEARFVAQLVYDKLGEIPSWKRFSNDH